MEIVKFVSREGYVTASKLQAEFDMPSSTLFDYFTTLDDHEFLVKEGESYRIGFQSLEYGSRARWNHDIYQPARSELDKLAHETNEQVYLMEEENGHGVTLYNASGNPGVNVRSHDGLYTPLHTTADGKAILAFLPEVRLKEIYSDHDLEAINRHIITDWDELLVELEWIRDRGVSSEREERVEGISSLATPIIDRDGNVSGSVAIFGPTSRVTDPETDYGFDAHLFKRIQEVSNVIEVNIYA